MKYALAAIALLVPLYPKFPLLTVPGTYVAVRFEDIFIACVLVVWAIGNIKNRDDLLKPTANKLVITYLFLSLISTLSAIFVTQTVTPHIALLHYLRRVEYMLPFFLAYSFARKESNRNFYVQILLLTTIYVFIYGIGQKYLGIPVISTQNAEFSKGLVLKLTPGARLNSTFAGHYDLAAYTVILIPIFLTTWLTSTSRKLKFVSFITFVFAFWLLMASASRISFPAYLLSLVIVLSLLRRFKLMLPLLGLSVFFMLTTTELAARYTRTLDVYFSGLSKFITLSRKPPTEPPYVATLSPTAIPTLPPVLAPVSSGPKPTVYVTPIPTPTRRVKRNKTTPTPYVAPVIVEERSTEIRLRAEWPRAIRAFKKNPLLGTGFSSITLATDNDFLRNLGETGLLGLASFGLIFLSLLRASLSRLRALEPQAQALAIALIGSMVSLLSNATFIDVFEASKVAIPFWMLMGLLSSLAYHTQKAKPAE